MWDVLLIAVIVAFFVVAAIVVRLLDGMITRSGIDAEPDEPPDTQLEPDGRTR
jgi:hypothetical protein